MLFISISQNPGHSELGSSASQRAQGCVHMYAEPTGNQLDTTFVGNAGPQDWSHIVFLQMLILRWVSIGSGNSLACC